MVCSLVSYCCLTRLIGPHLVKARNKNNAEKLLSEIIEFNRNRILCRLRSSHSTSYKSKNKPPIINSLAEALTKLQALDTVSAETLKGVEQIVQDMMTTFSKLETMRGPQARSHEADKFLVPILRSSDSLIMHYRLSDILRSIPHSENSFPEERKKSLVEIIRKLGLYIKLGPTLLRFARRLSIFRKITVRCIAIKSTLPSGLQASTVEQMPQGLLHQYLQDPSSAQGKKIAHVESRIKSNLVETQANLRQKSLCKKKIHAEIQLLFYYEQQPQNKLRPRVICSSKNACFLCNAFLRIHNQFYTPRTHGKLYSSWTLPNLSTLSLARGRIKELRRLYREFNTLIEEKIISSLETRSSAQIYNNESMILNIRSLTASEISAAVEGTDKLVLNDSNSLCTDPNSKNGQNVTEKTQSNINNEGSEKGSSKPSTSRILDIINGSRLCHAVESSSNTHNAIAAVERSFEKVVPNDARSLSESSSSNSNTIVTRASQNGIQSEGSRRDFSKLSRPCSLDSNHGSALCHAVDSLSTTQNLEANATPPIKPTEVDLHESIPYSPIPTPLEPKRLLPGEAVWSLISLSSPPTRFHTSRIHVELSYDQASSMASINSFIQRDSNLISPAERDVKVCAIWLTAAEAERLKGAPGEVDLADHWTCKKLNEVLYSPDGLLLRKGGEVLKLSAENMVL